MNLWQQTPLRLLTTFFSSGIRDEHPPEARLRIRVVNVVSLVVILLGTGFGINDLGRGGRVLGYLDLSVAALFLATLIYMRRTGNFNHVKYFWVVSTGLLFLYLFDTGGISQTGHLWAFIYPPLAAFLLGPFRGGIAIGILLACMVLGWGYGLLQGTAVYPTELILRFLISFSIIAYATCYYEYYRQEILRRLEDSNLALDGQIVKLKEAEAALTKHQEDLERRVEDRTRELQAANEKLQKESAERLQTAELLRAREEQYRLLFDHSFDVILSFDRRMKMLSVSPAVERILGYRPEELVGRQVSEAHLLSPGYEAKMVTDIARVFGGESISAAEYEVVARDGTTRVAQISSAPIRKAGEVVGMIAIARDITAHKQAEELLRRNHDELELRVQQRTEELRRTNEALETASRAKSDFLAMMSHELRTPLHHIMGFTELVVDKNFGDLTAPQEEYLRDVLKSSQQLLSLINDILDLSKVEAGKLALELTETRLGPLLEESMALLRPQAAKHNIRLLSDIEAGPHPIKTDERKLKQIVYNLLANAIKFTPDGGEVTLSARHLTAGHNPDRRWILPGAPPGNDREAGEAPSGEGREAVLISVRDTGIGIKRQDLERIFNPFEQVDQSLSRNFQGTGLGLSLCRSLVELQGGRIWAESDGEGKGSRFSFFIPLG